MSQECPKYNVGGLWFNKDPLVEKLEAGRSGQKPSPEDYEDNLREWDDKYKAIQEPQRWDAFIDEVCGNVGLYLAKDDRHPGNTQMERDFETLERALESMERYAYYDLIVEVGCSLKSDGVVEYAPDSGYENVEFQLVEGVMERLKLKARELRHKAEARRGASGKMDKERAKTFVKAMAKTFNSFALETLSGSRRREAFSNLIKLMLPTIEYYVADSARRELLKGALGQRGL